MRLLSRLEGERKSGAIWYVIFRQSPNIGTVISGTLRRQDLIPAFLDELWR